jgi:hypothetical protein
MMCHPSNNKEGAYYDETEQIKKRKQKSSPPLAGTYTSAGEKWLESCGVLSQA